MTPELTWQSAGEIRDRIVRGELSPVAVVDHFLHRIAALDPHLHAFDVVDGPGARKQAAEAEGAVRAGAVPGPLYGVPVAIMEAIKVKGFRNPTWNGRTPEYDDLCVERLRAAGAVIVGTTATYHWEPLERPRNPWDVTKDPGNSSRGSAVAVAAGMVPLALGMDGLGSTRLPAAWSGVVGVHPSRGLIPHVDYANPSLMLSFSVGPMARDVRDCALALHALAGPDGQDFVSTQQTPPDYRSAVEGGVRGLRLAWTDDFGFSRGQWVEESPALMEIARAAAFGLAEVGATVDRTEEVWEDPRPAFLTLGGVFSAMGYLPPVNIEEQRRRSRAADEAWGWEEKDEVPEFSFAPPMTEDYIEASRSRERNWRRFRHLFDTYDVLLSVTTPMAPRSLAEWGFGGRHYGPTTYSCHTAMFNLIGYPAVSVPCGFRDGLPVGLQIASCPGREGVILRVAQAIQDQNPIPHRPPGSRA